MLFRALYNLILSEEINQKPHSLLLDLCGLEIVIFHYNTLLH